MESKRVLIVDDNEINRVLLFSLLENYEESAETLRFQIHEAINGLEAVIMAEDEGFDLILMDINMPDMNGLEATRRIRSYNPKSVIIAVSGVDDHKLQEEIIANGADAYIAKPVEPELFYASIRRFFGG